MIRPLLGGCRFHAGFFLKNRSLLKWSICCCFAISLGPGGCFFLRPLLLFQPSIFCFLLQHSAVVFLFCLFLLPPGFFRCCGFGSSRILCFFLQLLLLLSCRISPLVPCHVLPGRALDKHCSRRALLLLQQQQQQRLRRRPGSILSEAARDDYC